MTTRRDDQHGDQHGDEHFDEVEAMRRFPSEAEWLDLPLPVAEPDVDSQPADFVERTLRALRDESELDQQLAELDRALPNDALQAFAAPATSPQFVSRCVHALQQDRRARWQQMLARYVAPEPSTEFVSRTLAALTSHAEPHARHDPRSSRPAPRRQRRAGFWPLLAAAAATVLWFAWPLAGAHDHRPLELRLALQAPPSLARAYTPTPMPAILASLSQQAEPDALVHDGADGVWLLLEGD